MGGTEGSKAAGVWVAEALNTAIEFLADATVAERHPLVEPRDSKRILNHPGFSGGSKT